MKKHFLYSCLFGCSFPSYANNYPLEFADFFEQRSEQVEVVVEGLPRSEEVIANVSYDVFQLPNGEQSGEALLQFLQRQRLTKEASVAIVDALKQGVSANPGCKNTLDTCVPQDVPGSAEFVFDYDAKLLRIFVSSDMFESFSGEKEYYNPATARGALVNWSNLYLYANQDSQNLNWTNETLLGLPVGYISVNSQFQNVDGEQDFDLYRAIYNYEMDDYRAIVGYQDSNNVSLNSTDFLNNGGDYSGLAVAVGSSANLLKGQQGAQQRLYFFAPQGGQLEVYQGERLLLTKVVGAGDQSIGYSDLPTGTYTLTLRLKQGSNVVFEEQRQVVNSASFSLPVGEWDYRLEVGRLDDENEISLSGEVLDSIENREYLRGLLAYRPMESWLLGSGVVSNGQNAQWLLGTRLSLTQTINMQYTLGVFGTGDLYQFGQVNVAPFSFSVRQLEHDALDKPDSLTQLLYGADNLTEYGVGVSGEWLVGRTYLNYFRYENESRRSISSSDSLSLVWTHPLWGGDVSINASYNNNDQGRETFNTGISWQRRFGERFNGRVGMSWNDNRQTYSYADASYTHTGDDWSSTSRVGVKHYDQRSTIGEGALSISGDNDVVRYDSYGYVNTVGERSLSGNISGTQMLSLKGGALTSTRGQAFVELAPQWEGGVETDMTPEVNYTALRNEQYWYDDFVSIGQQQLVDIPVYSNVDFALDTDSKNIDAQELDGEFFAMPGTYYRLDNVVVPLKTQVFILNDMNGDPVTSARCIGDGCKNVEVLSDDGVFRVNYRPNLPFKLVSDKRLCVYNPELTGERYIQAYCLPGLDDVDGQLVRQDESPTIAQIKGSEPLVYIGKYESVDDIQDILNRLDEVGLTSKSIEVGSVQYVYVQYQTTYSTAQRTLLESLDAYVILDAVDTKQLFTSR